MSDAPENHAAEPEHAAAPPHPELAELQEKLKRAIAECDRHVAEKAEVLGIADAVSREREDLRQRLAGLSEERDRLFAEAAQLKEHLSHAAGKAEAAALEAANYAKELASKHSADSLQVIWGVAQKETKVGLAFLRSKIPEGHPGQKWFDVAVDTATEVGCLAVQGAVAFVKWATPRVKELVVKLLAEAEQRLAKK